MRNTVPHFDSAPIDSAASGDPIAGNLTGATVANVMTGGPGNDYFIVDNAGDVVIENPNSGIDTIESSVSYTLSANVENMILSGTLGRSGYGNELDNVITGNSGNNALKGYDGNDTLDGGLGSDTLTGGNGNDTYVIDSTGDVIVENANQGSDTVKSSITFVLAAALENLTLTGSAAINGTGNAVANILVGNSGDNVLDGGAGIDAMTGGQGNDTYVVDTAGDTVTENLNEGIDTVRASITYTLGQNVENLTLTGPLGRSGYGNALDNVITGNDANNSLKGYDGNDTLDGGLGNDTLTGGLGNDTYIVDNASDVIVESLNQGTDTVVSAFSFTLTAALDNLTLSGSANLNGTGNATNNVLIGNSGDNVLDGGAGLDTLTGGAGNDTYIVDNAGDVVSENAGEGTDTVQAGVSYTLGGNVENLVLTGTLGRSGYGNALDNVITGNSGNNAIKGYDGNDTLNGGLGSDTLTGGNGNDTYIVDNAGDVVTESSNQGTDTVQSSISYSLGLNVENLTLTGTAAINGTGNSLGNSLTGNSGNNSLGGGGGIDSLTGNGGADRFVFNQADTSAQSATATIVDFNLGQGDSIALNGFGQTITEIHSYYDLARLAQQAGVSITAGATPGSEQVTLTGANGHSQVIVVNDTSGNGTAVQQYQAAVASLAALGTGLPVDTHLTYVARFTDSAGNVIASDGNNGWLSLDSFSVTSSGYASVAFGDDLAAISLLSSTVHGTTVGLEVEAYQTVGGNLQLVDQYLYAAASIIDHQTNNGNPVLILAAGSFEHDHWARDGKGALSGPTSFGWNFDTNTATSLTGHASFVADGSVAGGHDATLSYVVRFFDADGNIIASEGSNGWTQADGYAFDPINNRSLTISMDEGRLSTKLGDAVERGTTIRVEVEAYKTTASGVVTVDDLLFDQAYVSRTNTSGGSGQDQLSFTYGVIQQTHNSLDANNTVVATNTAGWNFNTDTAASLVDSGNFSAGDVAGTVPGERLLVGRFVDSAGHVIASEGSNGWVTLTEFNLQSSPANFPAPGSPDAYIPLVVDLGLSGSDKVELALQQHQLANDQMSFQVESLAMVNGQYVVVDDYLFGTASVVIVAGSSTLMVANAFTHTYTGHDAKGVVTATTSTGWDLSSRTAVTLANPGDFSSVTDTAANHAETLTYVMRFLSSDGKTTTVLASDAGSSGWVYGNMGFDFQNPSTPADVHIGISDDVLALALTSAVVHGTSLSVDVEAYRSTASGLQLVDDYLFGKATVSAVANAGSTGSTVYLSAGQYTQNHVTYDQKGVATTTTAGWDFATHAAVTLADSGNYAPTAPAIPADPPLTYYARFVDGKGTPIASDGTGGWISLAAYDDQVRQQSGQIHGANELQFGDDRVSQALIKAYLAGTTDLRLEVDGFNGNQLVDQQLFTNVSVDHLIQIGPNVTVDLNYLDFQTGHANSKGSMTTFGWDLANHTTTTLTSAGAYTAGTATGGTTSDISYYIRFVDQNGQTIATDGNHAFSQVTDVSFSFYNGDPVPTVAFNLGSDKTLLATLQAVLMGNPLARVEIEGYVNTATGPHIIDEYLLGGVAPLSQAERGPDIETNVGLSFTQFQQSHYVDTGKGWTPTTTGWDITNHQTITLGTPSPDVFPNGTAAAVQSPSAQAAVVDAPATVAQTHHGGLIEHFDASAWGFNLYKPAFLSNLHFDLFS